jgi:DNA helicase-2/ATP-dependent DNA helicase PcrA
MPKIAKLIGGAGTGKTTELLRIMDDVLTRVVDPHLIGFVSFTRAARGEAASRAADKFGCKVSELEQGGWFRTIHSVCYKALGIGKELLAGGKESREWLRDALQEDVSGLTANDTDGLEVFSGERTAADTALQLWSVARNRMEPLRVAWARASTVDSKLPCLGYGKEVVEKYEQAKRLDGRVDFSDLLARYAGYRLSMEGAERCEPDGQVPNLPVWFFDEQQDTSALLHAVCMRLANAPACKWVYVAGDPFQAIYGFSGADHHLFVDWPCDKTRVMPQSWRCAPPILECGESILRECSDYWDRKISPAHHDGIVEEATLNSIESEVRPDESWLVLARTNYDAARLGHKLSDANIPWTPTRGLGGWAAPVRNEALKAMLALEVGAPISGDQWQHCLKVLPSTANGEALLERGTKKRFSDLEPPEAQEAYPWVLQSDWSLLGITESLSSMIQSGRWKSLVDGAADYADAVDRWGQEAVDDPGVKVGTIHSVKGAEADNVFLSTSITKVIYNAAQTQEGYDAEQRVWYVGATRARKRLILARDSKAKWRKRL